MKAGPLDELDELRALLSRAVARGCAAFCCQKSCSSVGQGKGFALDRLARRAALHNQEFAQVGHDDDAVRFQVLLDLLRSRQSP